TIGAFDGGKLVCFATFYSETLNKIKHKGNLVGVYCDPNYRKLGITQQLIQKIIDVVTEQGLIKTINLSVLSANNAAISLYKKLGVCKDVVDTKVLYDWIIYYDKDLMILEL